MRADVIQMVERLLASLDLEAKVRLLTGASFWTTNADERIGLRSMVFSDGPAGVRGPHWDERDPAVNLPSPTALAATWNDRLVTRLGELLAGEARRKQVNVVLAPTVNLHRSPLGGRHFECLSEDPLLSGRIGAAYVRGLQDHGVAATAKHYVANDSETNRFTVNVRVDERTLHEAYLAPFEQLVTDGGVWLVMAAYNSVNGATMTENLLLMDPLKTDWGFDGVVVSGSTALPVIAGEDLTVQVQVRNTGPRGGEEVIQVYLSRPASSIDRPAVWLVQVAGHREQLAQHPVDGGRVELREAPALRHRLRLRLRLAYT